MTSHTDAPRYLILAVMAQGERAHIISFDKHHERDAVYAAVLASNGSLPKKFLYPDAFPSSADILKVHAISTFDMSSVSKTYFY